MNLSAVIPTVNDYIGYLGANQAYMGIVMSIFAVGSIISAPTMGRLTDRIGTSRPLVLTGICCHLSGAVVYFLAPYLPGNQPAAWVSLGRFLAGILAFCFFFFVRRLVHILTSTRDARLENDG